MLFWALAFWVAAVIAAFFAFGVATASIAKTMFIIFLTMFVICLLGGLLTGRRPPTPSI